MKAKNPKNFRVRANAAKRQRIRERAGELAAIHGRASKRPDREDLIEAQRELLGVQTMADPDRPLKELEPRVSKKGSIGRGNSPQRRAPKT